MEEYRVEIKVKNNNILKRIEDAGYKTVGEFCRLNQELNKDTSRVGDIINMKISPLGADGNFRPVVYRISEVLDCMPEDLFSDTQMHAAIESNRRTFQVNEAEMHFMLANSPDQKLLEEIVAEDEKHEAVNEMLETLTPREEKVINLRFGLNGNQEHTLKAVADIFEVGIERIRQIEAKALRKLRHPSRSRNVRDFMDSQE